MKLIVNPHKCEIERTPVNELEVNVTTVNFEFSDEIPNNLVKEAYFTLGENTYKVIINNNTCNIPNEVLTKKGQITIGVVAFEVINNETLIRFNPSPAYFSTLEGSLKEADNTEPITPSEMEQFEAQLQEGLNAIDDKIDEVDTKLETIDDKLEEVDTAIEETNNLNIDVNKVEKETTITLTKKDNTTKSVVVLDGTSLQFMWQGTSLGIKTDDMQDYVFVNLQGVQGVPGPQGEPFRIKKTYPSVQAMNDDFNNMNYGDYVMIASTVEVEDNAKLYTRGELQWIFITDFSGATGIKGETGATPNIQIGTVTSGSTPNVTRTGTNENPILNFTLVKGDKGDTGQTGQTGATGNGISNIEKTSETSTEKNYRINYTNGEYFDYSVENGEVTQEQLDEVQEELDRYKLIENALPHVTGTGIEITLDDTVESPMKVDLNPNTSQDTTTGKNKFDKNTMITRIYGYIMENLTTWAYASGGYSIRIPCKANTQYTISANNPNETIFRAGVTDSNNIPVSGTTIQVYSATRYSNTNTPIYVTTGENAKYIVIQVGLDTASSTFDTLQVEEGNEATSYEEFTGGIPAPNPNYPQDIHIVNGDNTIKVQNKNKLDNSNFEIMYDGGANLSTINNGIKATSSSNGNYKNSTIKIGLASELVGKTIRVKTNFVPGGTNDGRYYLGYCDVSGGSRVNKTEATTSGTTLTMVVEEGIQDYVILGLFSTNAVVGQSGNYIDYTNLIMTIDNEDMTYVKHQKQTQLISLGNIEYCEIGDNKDKIFKNTIDSEEYVSTLELNKWYIKKNTGKVVLNGSESWNKYSGTKRFYIENFTQALAPVDDATAPKIISNYYRTFTPNQTTDQTKNSITLDKNHNLVIRNVDYNDDTVANFEVWLSTHNTEVYYVLATPQYIILNNTLQTQLNNIQKLLSYDEQTNISQENNDLPFKMIASALKDISNL